MKISDWFIRVRAKMESRAHNPLAEVDWIDKDLYPFDSRFMDLGPGTLHYLDEGHGRPIVMLHGIPLWSFAYRHLISGLSNGYRCVAPDYFGFGLSDKPPGWAYRIPDHAEVIEAFIDHLDLRDITVVCLDWGGPIGLTYATEHPNNVHSIVLTNTFMWPVKRILFRMFGLFFGGGLGRFLFRRYNLATRMAMKFFFADRSRFTPEIHRHYIEPHPKPDDRIGIWATSPREIRRAQNYLADLWIRRSKIAPIPALLAWGTKDPMLGPLYRRWQSLFTEARTVLFDDVGHFVPEEAGPRLVPPVRGFLDSLAGGA